MPPQTGNKMKGTTFREEEISEYAALVLQRFDVCCHPPARPIFSGRTCPPARARCMLRLSPVLLFLLDRRRPHPKYVTERRSDTIMEFRLTLHSPLPLFSRPQEEAKTSTRIGISPPPHLSKILSLVYHPPPHKRRRTWIITVTHWSMVFRI